MLNPLTRHHLEKIKKIKPQNVKKEFVGRLGCMKQREIEDYLFDLRGKNVKISIEVIE